MLPRLRAAVPLLPQHRMLSRGAHRDRKSHQDGIWQVAHGRGVLLVDARRRRPRRLDGRAGRLLHI
jgi:hypothetical protein